MNICGEIILITGASSGIGEQLALDLAGNNKVIATGRRIERLKDLAQRSHNIVPLEFDVCNESHTGRFEAQLLAEFPHIDRVILNAGDCEYTDPSEHDLAHTKQVYKRMINVNFYGWINTLEASMPLLERSPLPHIVGISSQVTFAPFSKAGAYGASKAAASYFLKSLALDIAERDIDVSLIHPGFVDTPLTQKNDFPMPFLMSTEDASQRIIDAIKNRKPETRFPARLSCLLALSKLLPNFWYNKMQWKAASEKTSNDQIPNE